MTAMDPERYQKVKSLCQSALEVEGEKREAYLAKACAGDNSLRKEVEALLANQAEAERFMQKPALEFAVRGLAQDQKYHPQPDYVGRSLLHYRITEKIGEGGMGVVYRARDTRLARDVAIKALPESFSGDRERVARFEREARILATLNHPNIAAVHGLEEAEGRCYLVLELVEGRTLAERLKGSRIRLDETLEICRQIATGLEAAHERGIIHRDLKPSNIKMTPEGKVKILDFGLAKALNKQNAGEDSSQSPAVTDSLTDTGVMLGTAAYMSPEQARGKPQDKRTDVWAFGCILYECLTGRQPFRGETVTDTLAAVIGSEPDWNALPKDTPPKLGDLARRCLQKDPDHRLHDVADARIEMEDVQGKRVAATPPTVKPGRRRLSIATVATMVVIVLAATWFAINRLRQTPPDVPMVVKPFVTYPGSLSGLTFSPEGERIAFSWNGEEQDNYDIYVRLIGPGEPQRLTTDPADDSNPAWSPDGKFIAFRRKRQSGNDFDVFIVPSVGGPERRLAQITIYWDVNFRLSWSPDNRWLVTREDCGAGQPAGLQLISVETGEKRRLTSPPATSVMSDGDGMPAFSPDGRSLAFVRFVSTGNGDIYRLSLNEDYQPQGEPERLTYENRDVASPAWTRDGRQILYSSGALQTSGRVVRRIDLSGPKGKSGYPTVQESFGEDAWELAISPSGRRLAYSREYEDSNIYRIELPDKNGRVGTPQKFIASTRHEYVPEYSPDGKAIAFISARSGSQEVWVCNADGSKPRQLTFIGGPDVGNARWSPDGKMLVFDSDKEGSSDLYLISADGGPLTRLTSDPSNEMEARWSRDGKWIYFWSGRTGRREVYKMRPGGGTASQVTKNGGNCAFESPDGKWLYYSKGSTVFDNSIWRTPVDGGEESQLHEGLLSYMYNFVVVDDGIYFTRATRTGVNLEFIDLKSGKTRTVCQVDKPWSFGLSISPDHRWILCAFEEEGLNDLMLVENFR